MKKIKYMDYTYFVIEPGESHKIEQGYSDYGSYIKVVFDDHFICETDTGLIRYKGYVRVLGIGNEITITDSGYVVFRITRKEDYVRQVYEVLPLITFVLYGRRSALVHGAGIVVNNIGFLCIGNSGSGKTTLSNMAYKSGVQVLSDEMVIYDIHLNRLWGTSITSCDYLGNPILDKSVALGKIMCLIKSEEWGCQENKTNKISKIIKIFGTYRLNQMTIKAVKTISNRTEIVDLYFNKKDFRGEFFKI